MSVGCGNDATFTITPASCYQIADVLVDGVSVGAVGDLHVHERASRPHHRGELRADDLHHHGLGRSGRVDQPDGAVSVVCGTDQTFTITPASCYQIADVLVDGVSVGAVSSYTFTGVSANHTIAASFVQTTYTITASAGTGGSISPSGPVTVNCGTDQSFTITPASCYQIADVLVDGVSVGAVASYTFTGVATTTPSRRASCRRPTPSRPRPERAGRSARTAR